jgi:predicted nucleic acid-binding protein
LASGAFDAEPVHPTDWLRIADLVNRYRNLPLGTVDASVIACAERLGIDEVATVDRRHSTVVLVHVPVRYSWRPGAPLRNRAECLERRDKPAWRRR